MKKIKLAIIGSGGHAKSCIDVIENKKNYKIVGIISNSKKHKIGKYKVIGNDKEIRKIKSFTSNLVLGIGGLQNNSIRKKIFQKFKNFGFKFPTIIAKSSIISKKTKIREGTIIFNFVYINSGAKIGKNCIINNRTLIEHDAVIEDHCHISTGAIINGDCKIGSGTFVGSGSVLLNNLKIKKNSFIKMGTILKKSKV